MSFHCPIAREPGTNVSDCIIYLSTPGIGISRKGAGRNIRDGQPSFTSQQTARNFREHRFQIRSFDEIRNLVFSRGSSRMAFSRECWCGATSCLRFCLSIAARGDQSPVRVGGGIVIPTDRQTQDYLLCKECEDTLNKGGESWIADKLATWERTCTGACNAATPASRRSNSKRRKT
jgi:hypothetical protein